MVILLTVSYLLPSLQTSCSDITANLTAIHTGCSCLLALAIAITSPIALLCSALSDQPSTRSGKQDESVWQEYSPLECFGLCYHHQEDMKDDGLTVFSKLASSPSPSWPLLLEVCLSTWSQPSPKCFWIFMHIVCAHTNLRKMCTVEFLI